MNSIIVLIYEIIKKYIYNIKKNYRKKHKKMKNGKNIIFLSYFYYIKR